MNFTPEHRAALRTAGEVVRQDILSRRRRVTRKTVEDALTAGPYLDDPALGFLYAQDDDVFEAGWELVITFALGQQTHEMKQSTISLMLGEAAPVKASAKQICESAKAIEKSIRKPLLEGAVVGKSPEDDGLVKSFVQYVQQGNSFTPAGQVVLTDTLVPCAFEIKRSMEGIYFTKVKPKTDALMMFEDSSMTKVIQEIDRFWERKAQYDKLGLMHSRGILMYGPPGNGKSACLQQVVEMMVKRGDVVFFCSNPGTIVDGLKAFRQVEPKRRVVICFEEADELASYDERALLQLLDGDNKQDNVLYLATTNYINRLSPRMLRPGRFDKKVYIATPNLENRRKYLTHKLSDLTDAKVIENLAQKTDGMGFGHLRELIAGVFAMGDPMDEVLQRLREGVVNEDAQKQEAAIESKPVQPLTEGMNARSYAAANQHGYRQLAKRRPQSRTGTRDHGPGYSGERVHDIDAAFGRGNNQIRRRIAQSGPRRRGESLESTVDAIIGEAGKKRALDIKPVGKRVPRTFVAHRAAKVPESVESLVDKLLDEDPLPRQRLGPPPLRGGAGARVIFSTATPDYDLTQEEWGASPEEWAQMQAHEGQQATVTAVVIDDSGAPDYVDVEFDDGFKIGACSVEHLKPAGK